jgi:transaldolase
MKEGYFRRVAKLTPTRFWINNPTREETDMAIAAGAVGCTLNPSYCQKMIDHPKEGPYALALLDEAIRESDSDSEAEIKLQRKLAKAILEKFRPLYEANPRSEGYVSIQGDPVEEHDADFIVEQARANRKVAPNVCCKIPVTAPGLKAMEVLFAEEVPINATEIFGIRQGVDVCELHRKICGKTGKNSVLWVSHIAGIYDDYLKNYVESHHVDISPDVYWQGGLAVARKFYKIITDRGYKATFIGGGARGLHHFTEMVGGNVVVTINWQGTADKLLESDPPVVYRLFNPVPQHVIDELAAKLPDFKRGYLDEGLTVDEYEDFGPVQLFRSMFMGSWHRVIDMAKQRRAAMSLAAAK